MKKKVGVAVVIGVMLFGTSTLAEINTSILEKNEIAVSPIKPLLLQNEEYNMVIIAPEQFSTEIQPLIYHKNSHDVRTFLKTTEEIYEEFQGRDKAEQIKYFIKDAREQWNIRYVLLVGGKNQVPVRYSVIYFENNSNSSCPLQFLKSTIITEPFISDLYYADIYDYNGNFCTWDSNNNDVFGEMNNTEIIDEVDLYPDVYVGRLLCHTSSEVAVVVQKIIDYETNTYGNDWFENLILCGGDTHPYTYEEVLMKLIFKLSIGARCRVAWEGECFCNEVARSMQNFKTKKLFASGIFGVRAKLLTTKNINAAINEGAGFFVFSGHGSPERMITYPPFNKGKQIILPYPSGYELSNITGLTNGIKLPIAVFNTCSNGDFDTVETPIAWAFVQHENGGAIAGFACTTEGNAWPTTYTTKSLMPLIALNIFKAYTNGAETTGEAWGEAIHMYLNDENAWLFELSPWDHHLTIEEWALFGDPSLKIGGYP